MVNNVYTTNFRIRPWHDADPAWLVYDLGRMLAHTPLWFRRFIPTEAILPPPCTPVPRLCAHESRHVRQERSNHTQRRRLLRRRFVQELAR